MSHFIHCESLKSIFRIEILESIKRVCGYELPNLSPEYNFGHITLAEINNEIPTLSQKMRMLKTIIPILIEQLKENNDCVIQLWGSLYEGGLPDYYQYIFTTEGGKRYYSPELIFNSYVAGFIESWLSFEYKKDILKSLPFNQLDVILQGMIMPKEIPDSYNLFFKSDWGLRENIELLLNKSICYFSTNNDFEYFAIASRNSMDSIFKKWENSLNMEFQ